MSALSPLFFVLFLLFVCLAICFTTMLEMALVSARKTRLKMEAEDGGKQRRKALETAEKPELFVPALRMCVMFITALGGGAGILLARRLFFAVPTAFLSLPSTMVTLLAFIILSIILTTIVSFFIGGVFNRIAADAPEKILVRFLPYIRFAGILYRPLYVVAIRCAALFKKADGDEPTEGITEAEVYMALREGEKSGAVESAERTMVEGVFYLGDRPAGTFMTHRSDIAWLNASADCAEILKTVTEFRAQRYFPVAENTLDEVIGAVSVEDILFSFFQETSGKDALVSKTKFASKNFKNLKKIMRSPCFVPETMGALKAIDVFKQQETDILFVMDEYGGFTGILLMRDLVEEIVGELSAKKAKTEAVVRQNDGTFLADGGSNIDEIAELLSLPSLVDEHQDYHTLAGFILSLSGEIPRTGASFMYKNVEFRVVNMDANRIDTVLITLPPVQSE